MSSKNQHRGVINKKSNLEKKDTSPSRKNYILSIAIDNYTFQPQLTNAVKDAEDILNSLVERYNFEAANITRLYNDAASKGNIYKAIGQLTQQVTQNDRLIIYYAGHGYYHEVTKTGHLIPYNAKGNVWEYISNADLKDNIRAIPSLHTFLIVDSCFSGSLFTQSRGQQTISSPGYTFAERVDKLPSRWCLAAGMIEEVADGFRGENSPFAQAILTFLKTNTTAKFPASSLIQYVKQVIPNNAQQTPIGGILFNTKDLGGEFVFELKDSEASPRVASETLSNQITRTIKPVSSNISTKKPLKSEKKLKYLWALSLLVLPFLFWGIFSFFNNEPPVKEKKDNRPNTASNTEGLSGKVFDYRDNRAYNWVYLKDGKKWLTQNLNFKIANSYCYEDNKRNCMKYGRLYTWEAAQNACPRNWRLPTEKEWMALINNYGGPQKTYEALINGEKAYFSAVFGGKYFQEIYSQLEESGNYWTSSQNNSNQIGVFIFIKSSKTLDFGFDNFKDSAFSCRCVQD